MKKLITLALVLVLVLGLAAPAMAFTTTEYEAADSSPYEVDIMLVDYTEGFVSSYVFNLPETNRGYLVNEVVCAIASLYIPKGRDLDDDGYTVLAFGGENANVYVTENMSNSTAGTYALLTNMLSNVVPVEPGTYTNGMADDTLTMDFANTQITANAAQMSLNDYLAYLAANKDYVLNVAFFAKVTADDASVNVTLKKVKSFTSNWLYDLDGTTKIAYVGSIFADFEAGNTFAFTGAANSEVEAIVVGDYLVFYHQKEMAGAAGNNGYDALNDGHTGGVFTFTSYTKSGDVYKASKLLFSVTVNSNWRTKNVYFWDYAGNTPSATNLFKDTVAPLANDVNAYAAVASSFGTAGVSFSDATSGQILTPGVLGSGSPHYPAMTRILAIYTSDFDNNWGFDITAQGNVMSKSFFETSAGTVDIYAEVAIEPWYGSLEVPEEEEIIIGPPKTGAALSAIGFAVIAICGLAIIIAKKARA